MGRRHARAVQLTIGVGQIRRFDPDAWRGEIELRTAIAEIGSAIRLVGRCDRDAGIVESSRI